MYDRIYFPPFCSVCGKRLEYLGLPSTMFGPTTTVIGGNQTALEQWRGNLCQNCKYIFCPNCLNVWPPPACPICKQPTKPAMGGYLSEFYAKSLTSTNNSIVDKKLIECEGDNLEIAEANVKKRIPLGFSISGPFKIISDGEEKTIEIPGETINVAFEEAMKKIPPEAIIKEQSTLYGPEQNTFHVSAFDQEGAIRQAESESGRPIIVHNVIQTNQGKKGIFGIGRKPNSYLVNALQMALVKLTFKDKAKIRATIVKFEGGNTLMEIRKNEIRKRIAENRRSAKKFKLP